MNNAKREELIKLIDGVGVLKEAKSRIEKDYKKACEELRTVLDEEGFDTGDVLKAKNFKVSMKQDNVTTVDVNELLKYVKEPKRRSKMLRVLIGESKALLSEKLWAKLAKIGKGETKPKVERLSVEETKMRKSA